MINLHVEVSGLNDISSMLSGVALQVPYAASVAINNTLNDIQAAVRGHVHEAFHVRSPAYINRSIYIGSPDRARKDRLEGTVRINPNRDVLAKFEGDTTKTPKASRSLAVPVFREKAPDIIIRRSDPLSVKKLMAAVAKGAGARGYGAGVVGQIKRRRAKGMHGPMQQELVFLISNSKGTFLVERTGARQTRVLYAFKSSVPITPDLNFADIAMRTALDRWEANAEAALDLAIATAR
ncbi:MAG: hypothetical protein U9Q74_05295 [Gemmatimonadota bacterium]|nr:hypothetical protein [Gemmatimonadota bacterium]